jgi:hypothetical protein
MHTGVQYRPPTGAGPDEREGDEDDGLHGRRRGLFGRRGRAFVDFAGECAVCGTKLKVGGKHVLADCGWVVRDGRGLCRGCQMAGWEWPEEAVLPLRRSATHS